MIDVCRLRSGLVRFQRSATGCAAARQGRACSPLSTRRASTARAPRVRAEALEKFFCTEKGAVRTSLMGKPLKREFPDLDAVATNAQTRAVNLVHERKGLAVVTATIALYRLAEAVERADAGIAAPREDELACATHADHLVVDDIRRHPDQRQLPSPLAHDLMTRGVRDEVRESLH